MTNPNPEKHVPFTLCDLGEHPENKLQGDLLVRKGIDVGILPKGYESFDGGAPIWIELYEGHLRVLCWPNVNEEDPVIIDMEKARPELRD